MQYYKCIFIYLLFLKEKTLSMWVSNKEKWVIGCGSMIWAAGFNDLNVFRMYVVTERVIWCLKREKIFNPMGKSLKKKSCLFISVCLKIPALLKPHLKGFPSVSPSVSPSTLSHSSLQEALLLYWFILKPKQHYVIHSCPAPA